MRRVLALSIAFLALLTAGLLWTRDRPQAVAQTSLPPPPVAIEAPAPPLKAPRVELTDEQREARRFNRYDRNKDRQIDRDEYLANRRKSFARLDVNADGRLDFEEYAAATARKFKKADRNGDAALDASEFAATATRRKPKAPCKCED